MVTEWSQNPGAITARVGLHRRGADGRPLRWAGCVGRGVPPGLSGGRDVPEPGPNKFLATIQIGITLAGFPASATAAVTLAEPLLEPLSFLGAAAQPAAVVLVTAVLTFLTLVIGELAPKRVAMQRAERWALLAARPLSGVARWCRRRSGGAPGSGCAVALGVVGQRMTPSATVTVWRVARRTCPGPARSSAARRGGEPRSCGEEPTTQPASPRVRSWQNCPKVGGYVRPARLPLRSPSCP